MSHAVFASCQESGGRAETCIPMCFSWLLSFVAMRGAGTSGPTTVMNVNNPPMAKRLRERKMGTKVVSLSHSPGGLGTFLSVTHGWYLFG